MLSTESRDQNFFDMAIEKIRTIVNAFGEIQTAWGFIAAAFLIVLLCSYDPHEPRLHQYRRFVLEESVYTALLELLQGTELIDSIQELRSAVEERKIPRDVLSELLSSFMQGGGFSDN